MSCLSTGSEAEERWGCTEGGEHPCHRKQLID